MKILDIEELKGKGLKIDCRREVMGAKGQAASLESSLVYDLLFGEYLQILLVIYHQDHSQL